jgi:ComF family protein
MRAGGISVNLERNPMVYNWLNNARNWLFPTRCRLCLAPGHNDLELCANCLHDLPWLEQPCKRCALPLPPGAGSICGRCLTQPFAFDHCSSLFAYQYPVDYMIKRIKFQQDLVLLESFGRLLIDDLHILKKKPDRIVPVPLHRKRLAERGYNQSQEVLRPLRKTGDFLIDTRCCKRIRATEAQSTLPAQQRRKNLRGAFTVTSNVNDQHILLIDDVLTTGSTLNELAKTLKREGAKQVDAWVIARTVY